MRVNGTLIDSFIHKADDGLMVYRASSSGPSVHYHSDDLGNVLALTSDAGTVIGRNDYSDFGEPIFLTSDGFPIATNASPTGNAFLFRSMEWDGEIGLYFESSFTEGWPCKWEMSELDASRTASTGNTQRWRDDPYAEDASALARSSGVSVRNPNGAVSYGVDLKVANPGGGQSNGSLYFDPKPGRSLSRGGFSGNNPWSGDVPKKSQKVNVTMTNSVGVSTAVSGGR